jgi:hypothetical protein
MVTRTHLALHIGARLLQLAGVAVVVAGLIQIILSEPMGPPPCPTYRMHISGGRHGTPRFISFREHDFDAYIEAARLRALRQCVDAAHE